MDNPATENSPLHTRETCSDPLIYRRAEFVAWADVRFGRIVCLRIPQVISPEITPKALSYIKEKKDPLPYPAQQPHQFYLTSDLQNDINMAWATGLSAFNLATEPVTTNDLVAILAPEIAGSVTKTEEKYPQPVTTFYSIHKDSKSGFIYPKDYILEKIKELYT